MQLVFGSQLLNGSSIVALEKEHSADNWKIDKMQPSVLP